MLRRSYAEIARSAPGFPAWGTGHPFAGVLPGTAGELTAFTYRGWEYVFDACRILVAIEDDPTSSLADRGRAGTPASVRAAYGEPRHVRKDRNGTYSAWYPVAVSGRTSHHVVYDRTPTRAGAVVISIGLCDCNPAEPLTSSCAPGEGLGGD